MPSCPLTTSLSLLLLSTFTLAAPPDLAASSQADVMDDDRQFRDVSPGGELSKRLSNFVRIGRPSSSFVRIGRGSSFVRIGRPGNFVRIGRGYDADLPDDLDKSMTGEGYEVNKRYPQFVRIGRASRFVRIGKAVPMGEPQTKRVSSFVRIGKATPYNPFPTSHLADKRTSSFVRIGRIPSSAFVRIGRDPSSSAEEGDFGTFDRLARMGQSSFVRIGKREAPLQPEEELTQ